MNDSDYCCVQLNGSVGRGTLENFIKLIVSSQLVELFNGMRGIDCANILGKEVSLIRKL